MGLGTLPVDSEVNSPKTTLISLPAVPATQKLSSADFEALWGRVKEIGAEIGLAVGPAPGTIEARLVGLEAALPVTLDSAINAPVPDNNIIVPSTDPIILTNGGTGGFDILTITRDATAAASNALTISQGTTGFALAAVSTVSPTQPLIKVYNGTDDGVLISSRTIELTPQALFSIRSRSTSTGDGGSLSISSGQASDDGFDAGTLTLTGGNGSVNNVGGGDIQIQGGLGNGTGFGGAVNVAPGYSGISQIVNPSLTLGGAQVNPGAANQNSGGVDVRTYDGVGTGDAGGIRIFLGAAGASGNPGGIYIRATDNGTPPTETDGQIDLESATLIKATTASGFLLAGSGAIVSDDGTGGGAGLDLAFSAGTGDGAGDGGDITLTAGNSGATSTLGGGIVATTGVNAFAGGTTGSITGFTATATGSNSSSGAIALFTGDATGTGASGGLSFYVGDVAAGSLGGMSFATVGGSVVAPQAGAIEFRTGAAGSSPSFLVQNDVATTGAVVRVVSNSADLGARSILELIQDNAAATGAGLVNLIQDADGPILRTTSPQCATAIAYDLSNFNSLSTGGILNIHSNSASTGTRSLVKIQNANSLANNTFALEILQDANSPGLHLDGSAVTNNSVFNVKGDALTVGRIISARSNSSDTGAFNIMRAWVENVSATNARCLELRHRVTAGTALAFVENATDKLFIDVDATIRAATNVDLNLEAYGSGDLNFRGRGASAIPFNETGHTAFDAILSNTSVVGTINEVATDAGTYTPTFTNVSNVSSFGTIWENTWKFRNGELSVSGAVDVTPSTTGLIRFRFSIPAGFSASFSAITEVTGPSTSTGTNWDQGGTLANTANNEPEVNFRISGSTSALTIHYDVTFSVT